MHPRTCSLCFLLLVPLSLLCAAQLPEPDFQEREFTAEDPTLPGGEHYHEFRIDGLAGDFIEIHMASLAVGPYLIVATDDDEVIAESSADDHPAQATLELSLPSEGSYRVIATTAGAGETGAYFFALNHLGGALEADTSRRLVRGRFSKLHAGGQHQVSHEVEVEAGEELVVSHSSEDYDCYLTVTTPDGRSLTDDDGGNGTNSRIQVTIAESGTMTCVLSTYGGDGVGSYVFEVREAGQALRPLGTVQASGRLDGSIEADPRTRYRFSLDEPASVAFLVEWDDVDGKLALYNGLGNQVASNDDHISTQWSSIRQQLEPGIYEIELSLYNEDDSGGYLLHAHGIERLIRIGDTATRTGALAEGDDALAGGEFADVYNLIGNQGETWLIDLTADDFDPYLVVTGPEGAQWENDDFEGATRSRVEFELPSTGTYRVVVTSQNAGETGGYRLLYGPADAVRAHPLLDVGKGAGSF